MQLKLPSLQFPAHIRQNDLRQAALIEALRQAAEAVIPMRA